MRSSPENASGFTLVEVLIAVAVIITVAAGVAQLVLVATRAVRHSREHTSALILAAAKMDQLRSLDWSYEPEVAGLPPIPRSDLTTNLSHPAHRPDGLGLTPSPANTLSASTPPYVDYLDEGGSWVGNDAQPPRNAVFIRRWAVEPLATDPDRTLVLQVLVTPVRVDRSRPAGAWRRRSGTEAFLVSVLTRKGR